MKIKILLLLVPAFVFGFSVGAKAQRGFPFYNEIRAFKHQDSLSFPPKNGILFIGSSSIRVWDDLERRFPGKPIIKRGVGGSELSQLVDYYTPYILFPYQPRKIFIYAGENDIAAGKSADFVANELRTLWEMINKQLPNAKIYFMSIKPSPSRAKYFDQVNLTNKLIKNYLADKANSTYIDMGTVLLKANSNMPDSSLFRGDFLHLNSKGYDKWQKVLEPYLAN